MMERPEPDEQHPRPGEFVIGATGAPAPRLPFELPEGSRLARNGRRTATLKKEPDSFSKRYPHQYGYVPPRHEPDAPEYGSAVYSEYGSAPVPQRGYEHPLPSSQPYGSKAPRPPPALKRSIHGYLEGRGSSSYGRGRGSAYLDEGDDGEADISYDEKRFTSRHDRHRESGLSAGDYGYTFPAQTLMATRGDYDWSSDDFDEFESFNLAKRFEFTPSRSSSRSRIKSEDSSDEKRSPGVSPGGSDGRTPPPNHQAVPAVNAHPGTILDVHHSHYTGDALADGSHSVKLTVIHDPKKQREPLFRWLHVQQEVMDFQELSSEVARIEDLRDGDRNALMKLLTEVKRTCVKTKQTSKGTLVRFMEPRYLQIPLPSDESAKDQTTRTRVVTWICIPYFSLGKYQGLLSASNSSQFPNQTLLQAQYSRITRQRDMQQAVRSVGNIEPGACFHISQLWCIVIDTSYLVTCGTMSEASIRADMIDIVNEPLRQAPAATGQGRILVSYGEAVMWSLPVEQCETWFAFLTHFHDFWPQSLQFSHHDRPLVPDEWPRIVNLAKHSSTNIILGLRICNPPQPPIRGILNPLGQAPVASQDIPGPESSQGGLKPPNKDKGSAKPTGSRPKGCFEDDDTMAKKFSVFTWLDPIQQESADQSDKSFLLEPLQEVDGYLANRTSFMDKKAYQDGESATRASLFAYIEKRGAELGNLRTVSMQKKQFEDLIDIVNAADVVFQFFVPLSLGDKAPTAARYWGAVHRLIMLSPPGGFSGRRRSDAAPLNAPTMRKILRNLTKPIQAFNKLLSHASDVDRAKVVVPNEFIQAWLHLLMALIHSSADAFLWRKHIEFAESLIMTGMREVVDSLSTVDLLEKAVILPMDLISMISLSLFADVTNGHVNISETYSEYLQALESDITTKPSDRYTQHRINLLKQELQVIKKTIKSQDVVCRILLPRGESRETWTRGWRQRGPIEDRYNRPGQFPAGRNKPAAFEIISPSPRVFEYHKSNLVQHPPAPPPYDRERDKDRAYDRDRANSSEEDGWFGDPIPSSLDSNMYMKLSATSPGGFRGALSFDCVRLLQRRVQEFDELGVHALDLEQDNMNMVDLTKDRQEMAIYAFTIVTVVFLPLSAVASIFGMNTADVRDMELGQWAYWAAAVPTTISVIILGLWWMGELGNAFTWLGLRRKGSTGAAYAIIPPYVPERSWQDTSTREVTPASAAAASAAASAAAVASNGNSRVVSLSRSRSSLQERVDRSSALGTRSRRARIFLRGEDRRRG